MRALINAEIPFLVGGAYAFGRYTGIDRHTKDFDIFVRPQHVQRVLRLLSEIGCKTELTFPHWLGKAYWDGDCLDIIFSSGNGLAVVDEEWFEHAVPDTVLGVPVLLCPPEEIIWSKAFILERERYDGADIAHVIRASADSLNWPRLMRRFENAWHVLFSHLVLFLFIYPSDRHRIPTEIFRELIAKLERDIATNPPGERVCQGTLLSREQYLPDLNDWGYADARLRPDVRMTREDIDHWTKAIQQEDKHHA